MADELKTIDVTDLQSLPDTAITANHQVVVFTQDGDTDRASVANLVKAGNAQNECICIYQASLVIPSAQVLQLNTTPLTIVSAVSGYAIEVVSASRKLDFNTTPYATNTELILITSGATSEQGQAKINSSVSNTLCMDKSTPGLATATQLLANADLLVQVGTGDPTAGDSDITINVLYRVVTI